MNKYEIEFNQSFLGNRVIIEAETEDEAREKLQETWGDNVSAELDIFSVDILND